MSSPFSLFRKHQGILMVVLIGLAMLSFVVLGMVQQASDFSKMPPVAIIAFLGVAAGALAWVYGLQSHKSGEYGTIGLIAGVAIGLVVTLTSTKPVAFKFEGGSLSEEEFELARSYRMNANAFISTALMRTNEDNDLFTDPRFSRFAYQMMERGLFQYHTSDANDQEVMIAELLRREADRLGIRVSDEAVLAHLSKVTDNKLTSKLFEEIRKDLRVSSGSGLTEREVFDSIAAELKAAEAAEILYFHTKPSAPFGSDSQLARLAGPIALPPQAKWEITKQLEVWQRAEIARVPVEEFMNQKAEPTEDALQALFQDCRSNPPNVSADGRQFVEGRPGFFQPPRIQMAYLEADLEKVHAKVTASITDAAIKARFDEERAKAPATGPLLPELNLPGQGTFDPFIEPESPTGEGPLMKKDGDGTPPATPEAPVTPSAETPASPATETKPETKPETPEAKPAAPEATPDDSKPAAEGKPAETPAPAETKEEEPKSEEAKPAETPAGDATSDAGCVDQEGTIRSAKTVAFFDDAAATASPTPEAPTAGTDVASEAAPAPSTPAAEAKPEGEKPAATTPAEPASPETPSSETKPVAESEKPATAGETPAPEGTKPSSELPEVIPGAPAEELLPPRPTPGVKLLDEAEKARIRQELMEERTASELDKMMRDAQKIVQGFGAAVSRPEGSPGRMSRDEAVAEIVKYASENGLIYRETVLSSESELLADPEHAQVAGVMNYRMNQNTQQFETYTPASELVRSAPNYVFVPTVAIDRDTQNRFLYWKLQHVDAHAPVDMKDERVRKEVVAAWRQMEARKVAEERAKSLAQLARDSGKTLPEALAEVHVTDKPESPFITVAESSQFSWIQATEQGPRVWQPAAIQAAQGDRVQVGNDFMKIVFADELKVGDVVVAPDVDRTQFYVVRIIERKPESPEDLEIVRNNYLAGKDARETNALAGQVISRSEGYWVSDLLAKYKVDQE